MKDYFPHNYQSWKRIPYKSKSKLITRLSGYALHFKCIIYRIQLSRGRSQGFEPFSHNWQEPVIANSFPKGSSDWTRVYVLLRFPSIEVGQVSVLYLRLVRGLAQGMSERGGQSSLFFQKKVVESWSFTKRVVFKASELVELRAGTSRKECWQIDPRARGEGN